MLAALLVTAAVVFEKKWGNAVVQQSIKVLNAHLQVPVTISSAEFTFFDNFPHASIHLRDVVVRSAHPKTFGNDTLLIAHSVFLVINPLKLIRGDYTISACHVEQGYLSLRTSSQGKSNYDIFKPAAADDTVSSPLRLNVNRFQLSQMACSYGNEKAQLTVDLFIAELTASLRIDGNRQRLSLSTEGLVNMLKQREFTYAQRQRFALAGNVLRDSTRYELQKGNLSIDHSRLAISSLYDTKSMEFSLHAKSTTLNLASVLAFASQYKWNVPPQLRIRGTLNASVDVEGSLKGNNGLSIRLKADGKDLPCVYNDNKFTINRIIADFSNGEKRNQSTSSLNIVACDLSSNRSTAHTQLCVTNLQRPSIYAKWDVKLLDSEFLPSAWSKYEPRYASLRTAGEYVATFPALDSISLTKAILPKMRMEADMERVEVRLSPSIKLTEMEASLTVVDYDVTKGMLRAKVEGQPLEIAFSASDFLRLGVGCTRWTINASFDNFDFDRVQFGAIAGSDSSSTAKNGASLWNYARSIDGGIAIRDSQWKKAQLDSVRMRFSARAGNFSGWINSASFLGGSTRGLVTLSQQADSTLLLSADLYERQLDLPQLFKSFDNFNQNTLRSENLEGKLSGKFNLQIPLHGGVFNMSDVQAQADVAITNGALINVQPLTYLSKFISLDELMNLRFATLYNTISIRNGRVSIPAMQVNSSALSLTASGEHHFNGRYIYRVKVGLGDILFNRVRARKRNLEENAIAADDESSKMWLFLLIEGDSSSAYVRYDTEALGGYIQERVDVEKASLRDAWNEAHGLPRDDSARAVKARKQRSTPILWQDDPSAPPPPTLDTTKAPMKPKTPPSQPLPPVIWDE